MTRRGGTTGVPRRAVGTSSPSAAPTVPAACPRTRPSRSSSSEHCGGRRGPGHLRSQRLRFVRAAQAVREAALLRQLRHPQQGGEEPFPGGPEGPYPSTQVQAGGRCPETSPQAHV
ncbi:unnamed protein product, partial [Eretmochelys imbricata]